MGGYHWLVICIDDCAWGSNVEGFSPPIMTVLGEWLPRCCRCKRTDKRQLCVRQSFFFPSFSFFFLCLALSCIFSSCPCSTTLGVSWELRNCGRMVGGGGKSKMSMAEAKERYTPLTIFYKPLPRHILHIFVLLYLCFLTSAHISGRSWLSFPLMV